MIENVIFDRDGTLIEHIHYCGNPDYVNLNIDVIDFVSVLEQKGINMYLLSNQSGIQRGLFSFHELFMVHLEMIRSSKISFVS